MSLRLGGLAAIAGGALILAGFVAGSGIFGSDAPFAGALILAGTAALLIALIGLSSFQARRHPRLIWTAFAIPAIGTIMSCVGLVAMAFVGDRPLVAGLSPWYVWFIGLIATVVGSAVFAVATYHTRALSRPASGLLAGGSGLFLAVGIGGMSTTDALAPALMFAGLLAFSTGWIALGWAAVRLDRPAAATA